MGVVDAKRSRVRYGLLDDLGHENHVVALRRGIAERVGDGETGLRDVGLPDVEDRRGVRSRLDAGDVYFGELFDVVEHIAELLRERRLFLSGEREAGEFSDVVDVEGSGMGHEDEKAQFCKTRCPTQRANQ